MIILLFIFNIKVFTTFKLLPVPIVSFFTTSAKEIEECTIYNKSIGFNEEFKFFSVTEEGKEKILINTKLNNNVRVTLFFYTRNIHALYKVLYKINDKIEQVQCYEPKETDEITDIYKNSLVKTQVTAHGKYITNIIFSDQICYAQHILLDDSITIINLPVFVTYEIEVIRQKNTILKIFIKKEGLLDYEIYVDDKITLNIVIGNGKQTRYSFDICEKLKKEIILFKKEFCQLFGNIENFKKLMQRCKKKRKNCK